MIRLACSTLSCDGFEDSDFVESFRLMPGIGFEYVEFNCWYPSTLTPAKMRDLKYRCEKSGLIPACVYGAGFGGANHEDLSKDVCHKLRLIDAAVELGCRRICVTGTKRGTKGGVEAIVEILKEVVSHAEANDVLICLENHKDNNIETIEDYEYILGEIDSAHVGVCIDTGHFDASDVDMNDVIRTFRSKINHLHLKENRGKGHQDFVRFGEGTTDIPNVIEKLISDGYQGYMSVELSPTGDRATISDDLAEAFSRFYKYQDNA